FVVGAWFDREHINGSAGQVTTAQGVCERVDVDDGATGGVDENGSLFHPAYLFGADHVIGLRSLGHVQADDITGFHQLLQGRKLGGIAQWQLGDDIVQKHLHAHGFVKHAELRTDIAIANHAEALAASLEGAVRCLLPYATVRPGALGRNVAQQEYRLRYHQRGYTAGVGERCIEHREPAGQRSLHVHLVGDDAAADDRLQLLCCGQYRGVQLGAGAQPDEVNVA